jgi:cbb3-type cytochrome oxidase subunit 1
MPPLVRRYVKTSFVFLMTGLMLGAYIIVAEFVAGVSPPRLFITAHVHLLLVGFMLMIVMGVATWMFPRPARDDTRYHPELAETVYWIMTLATAGRAAAELTAPFTMAPALRVVIALGGLGQVIGAVLFVVNMWGRVRMPGPVSTAGSRAP